MQLCCDGSTKISESGSNFLFTIVCVSLSSCVSDFKETSYTTVFLWTKRAICIMILQNQPTISHCSGSGHSGLGKGSGTAYIVVTVGGGAVARNTLLRIEERGRRVILQYGTRIDCNLWHEASFLFHLRSVGMQNTPFLCAHMDHKLHLRAFIITCMQWILLSKVNKPV